MTRNRSLHNRVDAGLGAAWNDWMQERWKDLKGCLRQGVPDPDLENCRAICAHVADLLTEQVGCTPEAGRIAASHLCSDQTPDFLAEAGQGGEDLLAHARSLLVKVQVAYRILNCRQAERVVSIFFRDGDQVTRRLVREILGWDWLPQEVRDDYLRHGTDQMIFQVYPR